MTINIIHLRDTDYSEERFNSLTKEMNEQRMADYRIWDGIHDTNRIRGISKAHKQIVSYAKEKRLPDVCIAEDDVIFLGKGAFEYYVQNKPVEYDLYLGGISDRLKVQDDYIIDFRGMTLYMVHERFYDRFLSIPENINIDAALKDLGKYYLCPKIVCSQRAGYSYHKKRRTDYTHLLKKYQVYDGK